MKNYYLIELHSDGYFIDQYSQIKDLINYFNDDNYISYNDFLDSLINIKAIGFSSLKDGDNDYYVYQDKKLHYFCKKFNIHINI